MQETGNNSVSKTSILSVRLNADGLYFSVLSPAASGAERYIPYRHKEKSKADAVRDIFEANEELSAGFDSVQIFLDTPDTVFIPEEMLNADNAADYLAEAGIILAADERLVVSPAVEGMCAVMAFDSGVVEYILDRFRGITGWFSPLQESLEMKGVMQFAAGCCLLNITDRNIYYASFNASKQMTVAEVYPYRTDADIVYYLHKLAASSGARIYLHGSCAERHLKTVKKYFKGVSVI